MRPLTDKLPKALLAVGGKPLIVWHVEKLAAAGFDRIVINHAHLGNMIESALADGARFGAQIVYSREDTALETAGGIAYALHLLGDAPFAAVNADVFSDYDYAGLARVVESMARQPVLAHLVLVDNPDHHAEGDFALHGGEVVPDGARLTFSGIAAYCPSLFSSVSPGAKARLEPLLRAQIAAGQVSGEHFTGRWRDVGTPARFAAINRELGYT